MSTPSDDLRRRAGAERTPRWVGPVPRCEPDRVWDHVRHALVVCWLVALVALPVVGERNSSWDDVRGLVASGEVTRVRVSGELSDVGTGSSTVTVHWRQGLLGHRAEVVQVVGRGRAAGPDPGGEKTVVRVPPSRTLVQLQPGIRLTRDPSPAQSGSDVLGWTVPSAVALLGVVLLFVGLALLVGGPRPWRATRWAWFWLLLPPIGHVVFLLLSGPTPGVRPPRPGARRLTGGWAFLLSLPLASLLASCSR
ncbi:hypothetical protein SAMN04488570_1977 [Nocardioides scoriae]|uniref:Uncharacterized protein n=1 Tax=Nocardioides scoriae TaxID=642780 RepID=A0A1H1SK04_9ACTN|nr:hypothetical protein [Nocardioides scoriae]SDS48325.1 hypothetical protein SAMN04488570_1977 [Nocardioides scoriae]